MNNNILRGLDAAYMAAKASLSNVRSYIEGIDSLLRKPVSDYAKGEVSRLVAEKAAAHKEMGVLSGRCQVLGAKLAQYRALCIEKNTLVSRLCALEARMQNRRALMTLGEIRAISERMAMVCRALGVKNDELLDFEESL